MNVCICAEFQLIFWFYAVFLTHDCFSYHHLRFDCQMISERWYLFHYMDYFGAKSIGIIEICYKSNHFNAFQFNKSRNNYMNDMNIDYRTLLTAVGIVCIIIVSCCICWFIDQEFQICSGFGCYLCTKKHFETWLFELPSFLLYALKVFDTFHNYYFSISASFKIMYSIQGSQLINY